jgi:hypothetical protein
MDSRTRIRPCSGDYGLYCFDQCILTENGSGRGGGSSRVVSGAGTSECKYERAVTRRPSGTALQSRSRPMLLQLPDELAGRVRSWLGIGEALQLRSLCRTLKEQLDRECSEISATSTNNQLFSRATMALDVSRSSSLRGDVFEVLAHPSFSIRALRVNNVVLSNAIMRSLEHFQHLEHLDLAGSVLQGYSNPKHPDLFRSLFSYPSSTKAYFHLRLQNGASTTRTEPLQ